MLAHLCRLENIDPWILLPQDRDKWDNLLRSRHQAPGTVTGIYWSTARDIHHKDNLLRTSNRFPATIYQDSRRSLSISVSTAIQNTVGEDLLFSAELYVSSPWLFLTRRSLTLAQVTRLLEKQLGSAFVPETHWTSPLRSKAGLSPFSKDDRTTSTFTIEDVHGSFSNLLTKNGYRKAAKWRPFPTFYVEVVPSEGDLMEVFCLDPDQVRKVSTIARYLYECLVKQRDSDPEYVI